MSRTDEIHRIYDKYGGLITLVAIDRFWNDIEEMALAKDIHLTSEQIESITDLAIQVSIYNLGDAGNALLKIIGMMK